MKRKSILVFTLVLSLAAMLTGSVFAAGGSPENQSDSMTYKMSMYMDEYIECAADIAWNLGDTGHRTAWGNQPYDWETVEGTRTDNLAYANCPFTITFTGYNDAGETVPRFARQEVDGEGNPLGSWDILRAHYVLGVTVNGATTRVSKQYMPDPAASFPLSHDFTEAPHNGQIGLNLNVKVNSSITWAGVPIRYTYIDPTLTNADSADAGEYKAYMVVTITAL